MHRRQLLIQMLMLGGGSLLGTGRATFAAQSKTLPERALTPTQRALIAQLAETILPQTDTPGAIEAGVPAFVERMVSQWYTPTERKIFFEGLGSLERECQLRFHAGFVACDQAQRVEVLKHFETLESAYRAPQELRSRPDERSPFFFKLKQLTVLGYYTSEIGATQELRYNPVPMHYDGQMKFSDVGRQFAY